MLDPDRKPDLVAPAQPGFVRALLITMRPQQWVKNLFVAAPMLFSKNLGNETQIARAAAAVVLFCLLSGAVYVINDLVDIDKDRLHPRKRMRPIASGALDAHKARQAAAVLCAIAFGGGLALGVGFTGAALAYFLLNLAYSFWLKHLPFLDVLSIAAGFLLRVLAGALANRVEASGWLLACTALLACFLGFGKRAHELGQGGERAEERRSVLARYEMEHLQIALQLLAAATVGAYIFYTQSDHTVALFGTHRMVWTTPFIAFGITRFLHLVQSRPRAESPTEEMLRDPLFLGNVVLWLGCVIFIIYFAK
ncbi:MAG TPA: decaprenyl-phosphate phosphoribosyltransferase [Polyangia bacterium]|nr:decaprenyl-phosphate phosphoribosyltransferase [Polyangia bacterium]